MEKKKLMVNCATCDLRNIKKELLDYYENVVIHAAIVITSPQAQLVMAPYEVQLNCAEVISLEEDVEMIQQNGLYQIKKGDKCFNKRFYLCVNGKLIIEKGTEDILKQCVGISVNGKVLCPDSILNTLPNMQVNGKTESYPDGAVVVSSTFSPDRVFVLRARNQSYYASSKVILADEKLDVKTMAEKGVHFITKKAVITEKLLEDAIELFDEKVNIVVLEPGMEYIGDDIRIGNSVIRKYGNKLYVDGDARIEEEAVLEQVIKLQVTGTLRVKEALEEMVLKKGAALEYEKLIVERGIWITDKISVNVDESLLERTEERVHVHDVAKVRIHPNVTADMILERLSLSDCALVSCSDQQRNAVELVSKDVAHINSGKEEEGVGILDMLTGKRDTKIVNASNYIF